MKAVAFDLEGTVVDVEFAHHQAHILAAQDIGVQLTLEDCFVQLPHFIGGPDDTVAAEIIQIAREHGFGNRTQVEVLENKKAHYNRLLQTATIQPRKGFLEFYHAVRLLGYDCTIGSVTAYEQAVVLLGKSGLSSLFDESKIVLREHVQNPKPAPDVWIETAKRACVRPSEQIVFEDSPGGIRGASEVGAYCVGMPIYNRPAVISALVQAGARRIFMQWDEINAPNLIQNINRERTQRTYSRRN